MGPKKPPEPEPEPEPVEVEPQKGTGFFTMPDGSTYGTFGLHRVQFSVFAARLLHIRLLQRATGPSYPAPPAQRAMTAQR